MTPTSKLIDICHCGLIFTWQRGMEDCPRGCPLELFATDRAVLRRAAGLPRLARPLRLGRGRKR